MSAVATIGGPVFSGPVSAALESDLRNHIRRHGIVVWLDLDNHYSAFVDGLVAAREDDALPYEVRAFRGSHLALMMALEGIAGGTEKTPLLIHLPGFTEETVSQTPLYELYKAGIRYRKALDTLVSEAAAGRVPPDQIAAFKSQPGLSLAAADDWLAALLDDNQGGLASQLQAMNPTALFDDLLGNGTIAGRVAQPQDAEVLWARLAAWTGLSMDWRDVTLPTANPRPEDIAFAAGGWALGVEYVDDLKRPPVSPLLQGASDLPRSVIDTCRALAAHLRTHHSSFYERTANETADLLADEVEIAQAEDLGKIDTFRFEEDEVLKAALAALKTGDWDTAAEWAALRVGPTHATTTFWLTIDPGRQPAWQLVYAAAVLGQAIVSAGDHLAPVASLDAAIDVYTERGAAVDQAHRHLEQRRIDLLYPQMSEFETVRARLDEMRHIWRGWADAWARDFNALCRAHGFLPDVEHQQRTLFDQVVRPLTDQPGTTAYFVVDAFRYEMGQELYRQLLDTPASTVQLKARLAELPTITAVGMNVLAPVTSNGRLSPALSQVDNGGKIGGFSTGEYRVHNPDTRKRAMHDRVGGGTAPWLPLDEVVSRDATSLKRAVAQAKLVVVHAQEIDNAGEKDVGPAVFNHVMQKLRAAWHLLRDAGVKRFVFTADHGFLLLDESSGSAQPRGRKIDPMRRHVFSSVAVEHANEVSVPLADLGYAGVDGNLVFPESTAVFDVGRRAMRFVHGGNSLQERVIPVLTVVHRAAAGSNLVPYGIDARALEGVAGMHCLAVKVAVLAQQMLDFGVSEKVELALRVPDLPGVEAELIQTRGSAEIAGGAVVADVGEEFELFFRLVGQTDDRVRVELFHPSAVADVQPCVPAARFAVTATGPTLGAAADPETEPLTSPSADSWLEQLPEGGVRQLFAHLSAHGTVTDSEAVSMLGSPRAVRRFSLRFEEYVGLAPFDVRIDNVAGVKRYVREGSNS